MLGAVLRASTGPGHTGWALVKSDFFDKDRLLLEHHRTNICSSLSYLFAKSYIAKSSEIVHPVNKKWLFFPSKADQAWPTAVACHFLRPLRSLETYCSRSKTSPEQQIQVVCSFQTQVKTLQMRKVTIIHDNRVTSLSKLKAK